MSSCFAFSRQVIKDIRFEGKGKEALLEILVKVSNNSENEVAVKEIPLKQHDNLNTRKLDLSRILNYSRDVWELYKHGKKSKLESERDAKGQKIRRSGTLLVKGRQILYCRCKWSCRKLCGFISVIKLGTKYLVYACNFVWYSSFNNIQFHFQQDMDL